MTFNVQSIQELGVAFSKVLAPLGGGYAVWRSVARHYSQKEAEREKTLSQAVTQFSDDTTARQFFRDLQLQHAIQRTTGLLVTPAEFAAVYRFAREEHASLWSLRQAWQYRRPSPDGRLAFALDGAGKFRWWTGWLYLGLCSVAGGLFLLLAVLTSLKEPLASLRNVGGAFGMGLCALCMAYTNRPEGAVQRINDLRKQWPGGDQSAAASQTP